MSNITSSKNTSGSVNIALMTLSMFMTGASGMVAEYVLSTVSSYLMGSQIESFSLTIALMMGMMGLGGWAQRFVSDDKLIDKFVYLEISLAILTALSPIAVYAAFSYLPDHFQLVYYFMVMSIGFLVGFEIPFITRANARYTCNLKDNLSIVFAADYFGALVGAFFWVYLLLPKMDIIQIGFVLAALNLCVAVMTYMYFNKGKWLSHSKLGFAVIFSSVAVLFWSFNNVVEWSRIVEQKMFPDPIIASKKTPYQNLTLTHNVTNSDTRLYINNSTQFSSTDEIRYHELLVHVPAGMLKQVPERVLVLGGGDGLAVRELKRYDGINIDLIELDKEMFHWSKTNATLTKLNDNAFSDFEEIDGGDYSELRSKMRTVRSREGNRVFYSDASNYINAYVQNQAPAKYDMIVIDLPDPYSLGLNKMYTKQFYQRVQALMKDDGVLVTQATSPFHSPKAFIMIGNTLEASGMNVRPYKHNIPSFGEWGWWVASKGEIEFGGLRIDTQYVTDELAASTFVFSKNELTKFPEIGINTLMSPDLVRIYNNESWKVE